jgi:hypothetical protein
MENANPHLIEIYRARDLLEALMLRTVLEEAGVRVRLEGDQLQSAMGAVPLGWGTAPRLLVEEAEVNEALEILECAAVRHSADPQEDESEEVTRCLACGQLMGDTAVRCSSCGWSFLDQEELPEERITSLKRRTPRSDFQAGP